MKMIVYCYGPVIRYEEEVYWQGANGIDRTEVTQYKPDLAFLIKIFPTNLIKVYFCCPEDKTSGDLESAKFSPNRISFRYAAPIYKILVDQDSLTNLHEGGGDIDSAQSIDILSIRFPMRGNEVIFFDSNVPLKANYYELTFKHGGMDHPRHIESLLRKYQSRWFSNHYDSAERLIRSVSKILNNVDCNYQTLLNQLANLCIQEIEQLCADQIKLADYWAMLLVALECFQTYAALKVLEPSTREKIDFIQTKVRIYKMMTDYISPWKFSLFGHHHNKRAMAVAAAVMRQDNINDVYTLLNNQKELCEKKSDITIVPKTLLSERWTSPSQLKKKSQGAYYSAITDALDTIAIERPYRF